MTCQADRLVVGFLVANEDDGLALLLEFTREDACGCRRLLFDEDDELALAVLAVDIVHDDRDLLVGPVFLDLDRTVAFDPAGADAHDLGHMRELECLVSDDSGKSHESGTILFDSTFCHCSPS